MRRGFKQFILFLSVAAEIAGFGAFAKEKEPLTMPPPMAVAQDVTTRIGCPVTISLLVGGRIVDPLSYQIRRGPQLGTLGEIRQTGRNTATVIYTPNSKTNSGTDSFTFSVQSSDSPVSAAARVRVKIVEAPPDFEFPRDGLDFETVFLGKKAVLPLLLRNEGGGVVAGRVEATPPWSISGVSDYQLAGGGNASIALEFSPSEEKEFVGNVRVGSDPRDTVPVSGRGVAPVTCSPSEIVIGPEQRTSSEFSLIFSNRAPEPRTVGIDWPDFVKAPREITLQGGGNETIKASVAPDFLLSFKGPVAFRSEGFVGRIALRISAVPARLELAPGIELDLGEVKFGRSAHGRFTVKNTGGEDTRLSITTARELNVTPEPSSLILPPGKEQSFEVQLEVVNGGAYSGTIAIEADSGSVSKLSVRALFVKAEVPATKVGDSAQPVAKFLQIAPAVAAAAEAPLPAGAGQPVDSVILLLSTSHEIEISWKHLSPETASYRIERRRLVAGSKNPKFAEWVPWPEARVRIQDGDVVARFERMPANAMWTFRIISLDAAGAPRSRSMPFQMMTQLPTSWAFLWWIAGAVGLGVLVKLVRLWRDEQRRSAQADNARLARIGK